MGAPAGRDHPLRHRDALALVRGGLGRRAAPPLRAPPRPPDVRAPSSSRRPPGTSRSSRTAACPPTTTPRSATWRPPTATRTSCSTTTGSRRSRGSPSRATTPSTRRIRRGSSTAEADPAPSTLWTICDGLSTLLRHPHDATREARWGLRRSGSGAAGPRSRPRSSCPRPGRRRSRPSSRGPAGWACAARSCTTRTTRALLAAGIAVLVFDYRGFGDSEGDASYLDPDDPGRGLPRPPSPTSRPAPRSIPSRIGAFGSGGTGGGNAIYAGGLDPRVKAVVSQVPVADGRDWLHRMRHEFEWLDFLERIRQDRLPLRRDRRGRRSCRRARGSWSPPRSAGRPRSRRTSTTASRSPSSSRRAEAIFAYRPIDVVDRIAPRALMLIAVENDATTPEDHAYALYEKAGGPKRLVVQTGTTHYAAYAQYRDVVNPLIVEWFGRHLVSRRGPGPRAARGRGDPPPDPPRVLTGDRRVTLRPRHPRRHRRHRDRAGSPPDVAIDGERIAAHRRARYAGSRPTRVIDADGQARHPGRDRRPLATTASRASPTRRTSSPPPAQCAAGGVTTSFAMPNVQPPPNTVERLDAIIDLYNAEGARRLEHQRGRHRARRRSPALATRGIAAFKVFMVVDTGRDYPHMPGHRRPRPRQAARDLRDRREPTGVPLMVHPARPGADDPHRGGLLGQGRAGRARVRQGLRRPRRDHLGHRRGPAAAPPEGDRHPAAPAPHPDRRASSSSCARPRPPAAPSPPSSTRGRSSSATTGTTSSSGARTRSRYYVPEKNTEPLWAALARRDDRPDLHGPRAAHPRGEGARLDGRLEGPHRHPVHPVLRAACSSTRRVNGRLIARAGRGPHRAPRRRRPSASRQGPPRGRRATPTSRSSTSTRELEITRRHRPLQDRLDPVRGQAGARRRGHDAGPRARRVRGRHGRRRPRLGPPGPARAADSPDSERSHIHHDPLRSPPPPLRRGGGPGPADRGRRSSPTGSASTRSGCATTSSSIRTGWRARTARSSSRS